MLVAAAARVRISWNPQGENMPLKYLHTMVRVKDLDASIAFYKLLGMVERRRTESESGRFTLVFMCPPEQADGHNDVELTYNWDGDDGLPSDSRHFGHLAYTCDNIYKLCQTLMDNGVTINRPPRDGHMAFVRSPDNVSIELIQEDDALEKAEPWASMGNTGSW
jgi:lactoylglutathione lyase